jgi:hypothetical protein
LKIDGKRLEFNLTTVAKLYTNRTRFLELLLAAIYLTSGSLMRREELLTIRYQNTLTTKIRNLVIDSRTYLIRIVTTYHKSFNITRAEKTNVRFLSPRLSRITATYLLVFLPLYHFLNIYHSDQKQISPDLFENNSVRYTNVQLSSILYKESLRVLSESLTINPYRHLIKYIIKTRIINKYSLDSDSGSDSDLIEDLQANHSTRTSDLIYSCAVTGQLLSTNLLIKSRSWSLNKLVF